MTADEVLAVVVSYNGLRKTEQTVEALLTQVSRVHVVDNGSTADSLAILDAIARWPGVTVERLAENRGVGYALNRGVERARSEGREWLLTMDQDSLVSSSLIVAYSAAIVQSPSLGCLSPAISTAGGVKRVEGIAPYAITSGNLVRMRLFDEIGRYDEGFFIDCIDFDFSLRLRRAGYCVYRVPDAVLIHELGEAVQIPAFAKKVYARHSPVRRYYMYRNYLYMVERYLVTFPAFILKLGLLQLLMLPLIGLYDRHPVRSYRAVGRGILDYFARRDGSWIESAR